MEDMTKLISLVGGLLAFAGGVLAFLNGRLNEATTPEHRERVWLYVYASVSMGCVVAGLASFLYFKLILVGVLIFLVPQIVAIIIFLRGSALVSRVEVFYVSVALTNIVLLFASWLTLYVDDRLSDEQAKMKETISKLMGEVESLGNVVKEKVQPDLKPEPTRK